MKTLIINKSEVQHLLTMEDCIEVLAKAFIDLEKNKVIMPQRLIMGLPEKIGVLGLMPSAIGELDAFGVKTITVFPGNQNTQFDTHQGVVILFGANHGRPLAIIDAAEITAIRTAAASGLATKLLARPDASDVIILGSGVQARKHLEAMLLVRRIKRVRVWNPFPGLADEFAKLESENRGIVVEPSDGDRADVSGADIICTVTSSQEPVLFGATLPLGVHINAVGATFPHARELDTEAVARSRLFTDFRQSALNESGDFLFAKKEGAISDGHILGELGGILLKKVTGRISAEDITLFESLGLSIEDIAAAHLVYHRALAQGIGTAVEL